MQIPETVKSALARSQGRFKLRRAQPQATLEACAEVAGLPLEQVAKAELLKSGKAFLLAVLPANRDLDLDRLSGLLKRRFQPAGREDVQSIFSNCDPHALPLVSEAYGVKAIVDAALEGLDTIYFSPGKAGLFVRAEEKDFRSLVADAWCFHCISRESERVMAEVESVGDTIRRRVQRVDELPLMPGLAAEIIRLRNNPYTHASELASVIEQDPGLAAQLVRYAASPLYGYPGKVATVEQAIVSVLGMDFVQEVAFGLALGRAFRHAKEGPLGLDAVWQHALHAAALTQTLCSAIDYSRRPPVGPAYLAGLLHNIGLLLLGHLFPDMLERLNRTLQERPELSLRDLEHSTLGVTHMQLGVWLMEAWNMPREIIESVREHHNPDYKGDYSVYANLVYLANCLLARHGIGDAEAGPLPRKVLERCGLDAATAEAALTSVLEDAEGIHFMADMMVA